MVNQISFVLTYLTYCSILVLDMSQPIMQKSLCSSEVGALLVILGMH